MVKQTLGFLLSLARRARSLSCEGGAMKMMYGFKSELLSTFRACEYKHTVQEISLPSPCAVMSYACTCVKHLCVQTQHTDFSSVDDLPHRVCARPI